MFSNKYIMSNMSQTNQIIENEATPYVKQIIHNRIATISFFHPEQNSLPSIVLQEITKVINLLNNDREVRVIILKSKGEGTFCAGANFTEMIRINDSITGYKYFNRFAVLINAMRTCSKLIIVRAQGKAVGGGVGLLAAGDYCMAAKVAEIKLSDFNIGLGPFVIEPAIERKIGRSNMAQLTMDATSFYSSAWGMEKGLYNKVYEDIKILDFEVQAFAEKLSGFNPEAVSKMKKIFWKDTEDWNVLLSKRAAMSGKYVISPYTKEAIRLFKLKKKRQ